ncbi:type II toxin-antitoxin system PemK/MazF family toxin [Rhizobium sp. TH2]|uniref:type II toxin-antitoxin system PemK/MazF family toxin n=1 Tax=Rhizobium sp. TH2 TaxID=2775403 RepID=UPI0021588A2D|nr:type II toxin-antitoxin system PemK/MazF family toxin [Rhizobium sp. TH2]UVC11597.1 type II toxin-antitoxin system PemK/MazF family toxin [Rhizobium sp. TH2]
MTRGEVWTVSGTGYAGKPRPALIIQDHAFSFLDSITICPITSDPDNLELFRIDLLPSDVNGLRLRSHVMADKIITLPKSRLGKRIGILDDDDLKRVETAIMIFLGLA